MSIVQGLATVLGICVYTTNKKVRRSKLVVDLVVFDGGASKPLTGKYNKLALLWKIRKIEHIWHATNLQHLLLYKYISLATILTRFYIYITDH